MADKWSLLDEFLPADYWVSASVFALIESTIEVDLSGELDKVQAFFSQGEAMSTLNSLVAEHSNHSLTGDSRGPNPRDPMTSRDLMTSRDHAMSSQDGARAVPSSILDDLGYHTWQKFPACQPSCSENWDMTSYAIGYW